MLFFPSDINHIVYPHFTTQDYRVLQELIDRFPGDVSLSSHNSWNNHDIE